MSTAGRSNSSCAREAPRLLSAVTNSISAIANGDTSQAAAVENALAKGIFLKPRLHLPEWREPLLLVAGLLPEEGRRLAEWTRRTRSAARTVSGNGMTPSRSPISTSGASSETQVATTQALYVTLQRRNENEQI